MSRVGGLCLQLCFLLGQLHSRADSPQVVAVWVSVVWASISGWKREFQPKLRQDSHCFDLAHMSTSEQNSVPLMVLGHVAALE